MQFLNSSVQATLPRIFPLLQFTIVFRRGAPSFEGSKNIFKYKEKQRSNQKCTIREIGSVQNQRMFQKMKRSMRKTRKKNPRVIHVTSICPTFQNPSTKRSGGGKGKSRGNQKIFESENVGHFFNTTDVAR